MQKVPATFETYLGQRLGRRPQLTKTLFFVVGARCLSAGRT